jgi:hypothetical protein
MCLHGVNFIGVTTLFGALLFGGSFNQQCPFPYSIGFVSYSMVLAAIWQLLSFFFPLRSTASQFIKEWGVTGY